MFASAVLLASVMQTTGTVPSTPSVRAPSRRVEANPTPHPKIVSPHPRSTVEANPTPHPYPVPVLDVFVVGDRLEVKLRGVDGGHTTVLQSDRPLGALAFPAVPASDGKVAPVARNRVRQARPATSVPRALDPSAPVLSIGCDGNASDGDDTWSFGKRSSFLLVDGTKITFNGASKKNRCASVDVMSDGKRVHVSAPLRGKAKIGPTTEDRWDHDGQTNDGLVFVQGLDAVKGGSHWGSIRRKKGVFVPAGLVGSDEATEVPAADLRFKLSDVMVTSLVDQASLRRFVDGGGNDKGIIIIGNKPADTSDKGIIIIGNKPADASSKGMIIIGNKPADTSDKGIIIIGNKPSDASAGRLVIVNGPTAVVSAAGIELQMGDGSV